MSRLAWPVCKDQSQGEKSDRGKLRVSHPACLFVCVFVCVLVCLFVCLCVCLLVFICVFVWVLVLFCLLARLLPSLFVCVCLCAYINKYIIIYIYSACVNICSPTFAHSSWVYPQGDCVKTFSMCTCTATEFLDILRGYTLKAIALILRCDYLRNPAAKALVAAQG